MRRLLVPYVFTAFGMFLFWFMAAYGFSRGGILANQTADWLYRHLALQHGSRGAGPSGFAGFALSVGGFCFMRWNKGVRVATAEALSLFAAPVAVAYELGIWLYVPWFLSYQVTNLMAWSVTGVPLFDNATLLLGSFLVMTVGVVWKLDSRLEHSRFRNVALAASILTASAAFVVIILALSKVYVTPPIA